MCHMFGMPTLAMGYVHRILMIQPEDMVSHAFLWSLVNTEMDDKDENSDAGTSGYLKLATRLYTELYEHTKNIICVHKLTTRRHC